MFSQANHLMNDAVSESVLLLKIKEHSKPCIPARKFIYECWSNAVLNSLKIQKPLKQWILTIDILHQ